jgi:hypothetical protein
MRSQSHQRHAIERGMIVPVHNIDIFLANGWRLGDEPGCGTARMFPVASCVNRVPNNHEIALPGKKNARPRWRREPGRNDFDNARDSRNMRAAQ